MIELMTGNAFLDEIEGEWIIFLASSLTALMGVFALLLTFTERSTAIWLLGLYALLNDTI